MFNVEPIEPWTQEEKAHFDEHVAVQQRKTWRDAGLAAVFLTVNICLVLPFLAGFPLHKYWEYGQFFLKVCAAPFLYFVYRAALVYNSWQAARETRNASETRKEMGPPLD